MDEAHFIFKGEAQLAGWSDTHTGGAKVTLWLPDAAALDAFRAMTVRKGNTAGQILMVAMVEVGEGGEPVRQPERGNHDLSRLAAMFCADPEFWKWWGETFHVEPADADECADYMRAELMIDSRSKLDTDPEVARMFHENIRRPFMAWKG